MFVFPAQKSQPLLAISTSLLVLMGFESAQAQAFGIGVTGSSPNLGNIAAAVSGDTVFRVTPSGEISKLSGDGARVSAGSSTVTVTVTCGNQNDCNSRTLTGTISSVGSPTGRAGSLTNFDVAGQTVASESGSNTRTFTFGPIGKNGAKTFTVGMDFPIKGDNSGQSSGPASASFAITLTPNGKGNTVSTTGAATATVLRSLSLQKTSDLAFGRIVRPSSGSGTVTVSTSGQRSLSSPDIIGLPTPSTSAASYTVKGEGGRTLSINVPTSVVMTRQGGSDKLTVTTTNTISAPALSAAMGQQGSYGFSVGGSFPISSTTAPGAYSGVFTVTAAYN